MSDSRTHTHTKKDYTTSGYWGCKTQLTTNQIVLKGQAKGISNNLQAVPAKLLSITRLMQPQRTRMRASPFSWFLQTAARVAGYLVVSLIYPSSGRTLTDNVNGRGVTIR